MNKTTFIKLRYRTEYFGILLVWSLVRALPRRLALAIGAGLGRLTPLFQPARKVKARENLRRAFPDLPEERVRKLLQENFRQLGISGVEMLRLDRYHDPRTIEQYFEFQGLEHLRAAFAEGRGVFILTGHVGFWEAGAMFLPQLGYPVDFIYKRMKNPYVEQLLLALREKAGGRCIEKGRAARKIMRSLAENRGVAVLLDQRVGPSEAVRVDFFGTPVNATPVIAQLAIKLGTPVVPIFSHRLADNRYLIVAEPALHLPQQVDPEAETVVAATQQMTASIEAAVRRTPEQWFWVHDRWRL